MTRSIKKGIFTDPKLLKKVAGLKVGDRKVIKTWSRDSVIAPEMVGFVFGVHNGRTHIEVTVNENMVGHRLGEFAPSRKFVVHGGRMAKEEAKAAADKAQAATAPTKEAPAKK